MYAPESEPPFLPGDVALSRSHTLVGWGIRLGTRSWFNHARLVTSRHGDVYEALGRGFVPGHVRASDIVLRPPLTAEQRHHIPRIAESLAGIKYGYADVAALGLAQFGVHLHSVDRKIMNPDHLFCSQAVDYAWTIAGFHAFTDGRTPQDVTPGDLGLCVYRHDWMVVQGW